MQLGDYMPLTESPYGIACSASCPRNTVWGLPCWCTFGPASLALPLHGTQNGAAAAVFSLSQISKASAMAERLLDIRLLDVAALKMTTQEASGLAGQSASGAHSLSRPGPSGSSWQGWWQPKVA